MIFINKLSILVLKKHVTDRPTDHPSDAWTHPHIEIGGPKNHGRRGRAIRAFRAFTAKTLLQSISVMQLETEKKGKGLGGERKKDKKKREGEKSKNRLESDLVDILSIDFFLFTKLIIRYRLDIDQIQIKYRIDIDQIQIRYRLDIESMPPQQLNFHFDD